MSDITQRLRAAVEVMGKRLDYDKHNVLTQCYFNEPSADTNGGPYPWQAKFHAAGSFACERAALCGNRMGKSYMGAAEVAMHLTGLYPKWWTGKRYPGAITAWAAGITNESTRDSVQLHLLGDIRYPEKVGTGMIPRHTIGEWDLRVCGVKNVVDRVQVKHLTGDWSTLYLKSYEQTSDKFQATPNLALIWLDEEPSPHHGPIFTECQTRLADCKVGGQLMFTRTPLFGMSEIVTYFLENEHPSVFYVKAGWKDAPHITDEVMERLMANYPEHERNTRILGDPIMGTGRVFTFMDEDVMIDPIPIAPHWRKITGIDFGIAHKFGCVRLAHDVDNDVVYIYDAWGVAGQTPDQHAYRIKSGQPSWVPIAWPHDGGHRDKASGKELVEHYREHDLNFIGVSARYDDESGGGQPVEPIVMEINQRARSGRLKVFSTAEGWFAEKRRLHRDDNGKIVAKNDDILKASMYALMMIRFAANEAVTNMPTRTEGRFDPLRRNR